MADEKLFVAGLGVGPSMSWDKSRRLRAYVAVFLGPISEFIGRQKVLHGSFACFFRTSICFDYQCTQLIK
jgi:hypothetical protein